MPATYGSVTPSVAATATAASAAVPPARRTDSPAFVASAVSDTTAPPVPTATDCFGSGLAAGAAPAAGKAGNTSPVVTMAMIAARIRMDDPLPVATGFWFYSGLIVLTRTPAGPKG